MFVLSWFIPPAMAIFIILFDIYWLLKTVFLSFHLRATFQKTRANMKKNWLNELRRSSYAWQAIHHLIILPMHKESYEILGESFESLRGVNYPKEKCIVVLSVEGGAGAEALHAARRIEREFGGVFFRFLLTVHPDGISGELPGKGSNETWAAKEAKEKIIDSLGLPYEKIVVSVLDADTQVLPEYFGILTHAFFAFERPQRSSFQPIPLFTNNIFQAPALARVIA